MRRIDVHDVIDNSKMNSFFRYVWLITFLALFFDGIDQGLYGSVLPAMMAELKISPAVAGLVGSAALWGAIVGAIVFGVMTDRYGRRVVLLVAVLFYTIFTALCATVTNNMYLLAAWRFLAGMGIATITPTTQAMLSEYTPKSSRRSLLTSNGNGIVLGLLIIPLITMQLLPHIGWRMMFALALVALVLVPFILKLPESMVLLLKKGNRKEVVSILTKANPSFVPQEDDEYVVKTAETVKLSVRALFEGGLARNTILIWTLFFINMFVLQVFMIWFPKLAMNMGYSFSSALILSTTMWTGYFIGTLIAGKVADKLGYKITIAACYALAALFVVLMSFKTNILVFGILLFCMGASNCVQNLTYPFASANYPISVRATGMGTGAAATRLGGAFAPIVIGLFVGQGMTTLMIFRLLVIPLAIGIVAAMLTNKPKFEYE
ncbi:4-hydroxybenzoate transporter PcaK [Moorella humiferrea]|uniref:MFS transporter n=1 Tax=Neomoorella humiferrea TaxID=676965 RepID=UPI0030D4D72D